MCQSILVSKTWLLKTEKSISYRQVILTDRVLFIQFGKKTSQCTTDSIRVYSYRLEEIRWTIKLCVISKINKMKIFYLIRNIMSIIGIEPIGENQYRFNWKRLLILLICVERSFSSTAFFLIEAKSFRDYTYSLYMSATSIFFGCGYTILIYNANSIYALIDTFEIVIDSRKYEHLMSISRINFHYLILKQDQKIHWLYLATKTWILWSKKRHGKFKPPSLDWHYPVLYYQVSFYLTIYFIQLIWVATRLLYHFQCGERARNSILFRMQSKIDESFSHRFSFADWHSPMNYFISSLALAVSTFVLLSCCSCLISLFIGICCVFMTFSKDMKIELHSLKESKNEAETVDKFRDFVMIHSTVKELSGKIITNGFFIFISQKL